MSEIELASKSKLVIIAGFIDTLVHEYLYYVLALIVVLFSLLYFSFWGFVYLGYFPFLNTTNATQPNSDATENTVSAESSVSSDVVPQTIYVAITGQVAEPGLYSLDQGSRVADLLDSAGGLTPLASNLWLDSNLNLARILSDGESLHIPSLNEFNEVQLISLLANYQETPSNSTNSSSSNSVSKDSESSKSSGAIDNVTSDDTTDTTDNNTLISLNTASSKELVSLPGVGATYAQRIIDNRPYMDINELKEKTSIPASTIDKFVDLIVF